MSAQVENLIKNLGPTEIRIVEDYIHSLAVLSRSTEDSKQLKYFKLLAENKNITKEDVYKIIGTKDLKSIKRHLSSKIHDALLQTKHIHNSEIFNEREQILFELKKKILLVKILNRSLSKGKAEIIEIILSDIVKIAKENEAFDVIVEALGVKKYLKGVRSGSHDFDKINSEIYFYNACIKATQTANDAYYKLILNNSFIQSLSQNELTKHIEASISQLEADFKFTKALGINYFLHILKMAFYERERDYHKSIEYCKKLLAILKKHPVIYRTERMGFVYDNLSQFKTYIGDYVSAANEAKKAQLSYVIDSFNYYSSKEQEFYAYFYGKNYIQAFKCLAVLQENHLSDSGGFRKSKYTYFQACTYFELKKFKEALNLLTSSLEIEKDKTRWNISLRILNIMIFIELNKIDEATTAMESLRKHVERSAKNGEIKPRKLLIVKLLRELEKTGFQLNKNNSSAHSMLKNLSSKGHSFSWEHYTSELIPFDKWLKNTL